MITIKIDKSKLNNYEKQSAFISFKYDIDLVELMRSLPIRFYHKDTKEWSNIYSRPTRGTIYIKCRKRSSE